MKNTTNTFRVIFYLKKSKTSDGKAPIYARITVDGKRAEISVKQSIEEKLWNADQGMAKGIRDEVRSLNLFLEAAAKKKIITAEAIKNTFQITDLKEFTLCRIMDYHNTNLKDSLARGTIKNYFTTQRYVHRFMKKRYNVSDLYLSELSFKFITEFELFLRNHKPLDHHKPLANNGVMKHIERLRKMIGLAVRMGGSKKIRSPNTS